MKKSRKLILNRETLHSLELRSVAGRGLSYGLCGEGAGTTRYTNTSNPITVFGCNTEVCSDFCATGGAPCTGNSYCQCL